MPSKPTSKAFPVLESEEVAKRDEEQTKHLLVSEDSPDYLKKVELIDAICQAPDKAARRNMIADAAKALGRSTRTIKRMVEKVEQVGVASLCVGRKDKGQYRISKQWHDFIVGLRKWGSEEGSRENHNQIFGHLQALASKREKLQQKNYDEKFKRYSQVREDLIAGKHPSHVTVYNVINSCLEEKNKRVRHPGSPLEGQIIETTEGILEITHSNQIWQIDHTKLDILLLMKKIRKLSGVHT